MENLKAINDTNYFIEHLDLNNLYPNLFMPFKEIKAVKKRILGILNGQREVIEPVDVPVLKHQSGDSIVPTLSVLIASQKDLHLGNLTSADIYYQLPSAISNEREALVDLFLKNKKIIPWFPAILIGEDYVAATEFLRLIKPKHVVTNNTGIAYAACEQGIPWIAGPYLNIANSFSLLCLKTNFKCYGAFISNELCQHQIKRIKTPADFKLYYSIYHPIMLLTSRQCLFYQVTGCEKKRVDDACIRQCEKATSITNLKNVSLYIQKTKGNYARIYHETHYLNADIIADFSDRFFNFFIDLRDIKTETQIKMDKSTIIQHFENILHGNVGSLQKLKQSLHPTTSAQYKKGI